MNLAETLVPLLPLTPTGSMTLKADHPRRVWELDETYHTASQRHRFERQHGSKTKLRSCFRRFHFGAKTILKMTVADGRRGRQYTSILR